MCVAVNKQILLHFINRRMRKNSKPKEIVQLLQFVDQLFFSLLLSNKQTFVITFKTYLFLLVSCPFN